MDCQNDGSGKNPIAAVYRQARRFICVFALVAAHAGGLRAAEVFIEAETFSDLGGWVVDQQFMDQMGSPYLLAHGIGRPVADAVTSVNFSDGGKYRLYVRTRDWVAPQGPGKFVVQVGQWVSRELGQGDGRWHWEFAGEIEISGECEIRLKDLTGFEGRVDALCFRTDESGAIVRAIQPPVRGEDYDFVVVGGGFAGMCAAIAAARQGLKTALVQDRPLFGGNGSSECRVRPVGRLDVGPFPRNADIMYEMHTFFAEYQGWSCADNYKLDDTALGEYLVAEPNLAVFSSTRAVGVELDEHGAIALVVLHDIRTARRRTVSARFFCDATGDASLARAAGAATMWNAESREETGEALAPPLGKRHLGGALESSCLWFSEKTGRKTTFPACPWALRIERDEDALVGVEIGKSKWIHAGNWSWGSGFYRDPVKDGEAIRDWNFRAIYGTWDYLKNRSPYVDNYADAEIYFLGYVLAKRDARRIVGDYVLNANDLMEKRVYPDGIVTTSWYLDLHFPNAAQTKKFPGGEFRAGERAPVADKKDASIAAELARHIEIEPYPIPFRSLYSRDVPNLFAAGKVISGTFAALSSYRVENTCGMTGTVVGRAAAVCRRLGVMPRELGRYHFGELAKVLSDPGPETERARRGRLSGKVSKK